MKKLSLTLFALIFSVSLAAQTQTPQQIIEHLSGHWEQTKVYSGWTGEIPVTESNIVVISQDIDDISSDSIRIRNYINDYLVFNSKVPIYFTGGGFEIAFLEDSLWIPYVSSLGIIGLNDTSLVIWDRAFDGYEYHYQKLLNTSIGVASNIIIDGQTLFLNYTYTQNLQLEVFDMMGKQVISKNLGSVNGDNRVSLPIESLPSGVYLLSLSTSKGQQVVKWVK
jgi:hypothetical protein